MIPIRFCVGYFGGRRGKRWIDPRAWKEFASCCGVNLAGGACGSGLGGGPRWLAWLARLGGRRCFPCASRVGEGAGRGSAAGLAYCRLFGHIAPRQYNR